MTDVAGIVRFVDIVEDETVREELDEITGRRQRVIIEDREKKLHPHIEVVQKGKGDKEKRLRDFVIPEGAQLTIEDGAEVYAGQTLAKVSREAYKDARHYGRSAAGGRVVRSAAPQGSGHDLRSRWHRPLRRDQARQARDLHSPRGRGAAAVRSARGEAPPRPRGRPSARG